MLAIFPFAGWSQDLTEARGSFHRRCSATGLLRGRHPKAHRATPHCAVGRSWASSPGAGGTPGNDGMIPVSLSVGVTLPSCHRPCARCSQATPHGGRGCGTDRPCAWQDARPGSAESLAPSSGRSVASRSMHPFFPLRPWLRRTMTPQFRNRDIATWIRHCVSAMRRPCEAGLSWPDAASCAGLQKPLPCVPHDHSQSRPRDGAVASTRPGGENGTCRQPDSCSEPFRSAVPKATRR